MAKLAGMVDCAKCEGQGVVPGRDFGSLMRARRKKAALTMRTVAKSLGYSIAYLCDLELGRRPWTHDLARRYLEALDADR